MDRPPRRHRALASLTGVVVFGVVLAGCGDSGADPDATAQPTDTVTVTDRDTVTLDQTVTDTVTGTATDTDRTTVTVTRDDDVSGDRGDDDGAPFPANTRPDTSEASGRPVLFTDLRIGRHDGFDRVVWEFAGGGTPGWRVQYTDDPSEQGSGRPVDLPGSATLEVVITGNGLPGDVPVPTGVEYYDGAAVRAARSTELVTQVRAGGVFEGILQSFVGVSDGVPFRVYSLSNPTRVVLEVRGR